MFTNQDHTFVVCAYKENPYLEETIQSLEAQTIASAIMVSTSTPNEYIKSICALHEIPMVVNPRPHLAGDDWNYGLSSASTSLVTIAHQDDYYEPDFLECVLGTLNKLSDDVMFTFTNYYELRDGVRVSSNRLLRIKQILNAPLKHSCFNGSSFIKQRCLSLGDAICCPAVTFVKGNIPDNPFDTHYINSCDYKTWVDLARKEGRFVYIPKQLLGHRIYEGSATTKNLSENIRKGEDFEILSTLWPRPLAGIINKLYSLSENSNSL